MLPDLHPYPTYKPSGIEWLGDVPAHWEVSRLKSHLMLNDSGVWSNDFSDEGTVVLRSTEQTVNGGWRIEFPARLRLPVESVNSALLKAGDLVITKSSGSAQHIGKTSLVTKEIQDMYACFSNFMQRLRLDKHTKPAFVWRCLNSSVGREQFVYFSTTTTGLGNLNGTLVGGCRFAFPPPEEQAAIVRYLDRADDRIQRYIANKECLVELLTEQKRAVVNQAVTRGLNPNVQLRPSGVDWLGDVPAHWEVLSLKHWVHINQEVLSDNTSLDYEFDYIEIGAVSNGVLTHEPKRLAFGNAPSRARHIVNDGDTIISTVRTYLKAVWFADQTQDDLICSTGFAVLTPRQETIPKFVSYLVQSDMFTDRVTAESVGVAYPAISEGKLSCFYICCPPSDEQAAIVEHLDRATEEIDATIDRARRQVELMTEYRSRLIADVVTGKVDVREAAQG